MIINQVSFSAGVLSHSAQSLSLSSACLQLLYMLSFYLVSVEAQRPAEYRGSTKSPCKTLASTLLFGWPRGLSHERLFLARFVAGREREECKKERRQLWLSTRGGGWTHHNWWECTKSASHCVESNFAACASGICTLLAWGLSFYLKLPQQKKSHIVFKLPFVGQFTAGVSSYQKRSRNTPGQVDIRTPDTCRLSPSPDTHIITTVVCLFWLMTLSTANKTGHKHSARRHLWDPIAAWVPPVKPCCACNCSAETSRGGCCCVYTIIYKTRELHPSPWQL